MKERPILFSGAMVRAILDGKKTVTRRVVKPQPPTTERIRQVSGSDYHLFTDRLSPGVWRVAGPVWAVRDELAADHGRGPEPLWRCPYGAPGDRLWVRETWATQGNGPDDYPTIIWRADMAAANYAGTTDPAQWKTTPPGSCSPIFYLESDHLVARWRPSIHMPRWASRITLEVTEVRVERVQSITAADILAEGAVERAHQCEYLGKSPVSAFDGKVYPDLLSLWAAGWDSINGSRPGCSWAENPWVWAVTFRRVE